MREWIMEQGIVFYFFCSVGVLGAAAAAAANRMYKRLIREADAMEKSEHRLIKYIKLKYSSYYTLGLKANDEQSMVKRYLYRYKMGPMTLVTWSKLGLAALGAVVLGCLANILYRLNMGSEMTQMFPTVIAAAFVALALGMQYKLYGFKEKQDVFCAQMEDNLQNFLKNKIEYGHVLEERKEASVYKYNAENSEEAPENSSQHPGVQAHSHLVRNTEDKSRIEDKPAESSKNRKTRKQSDSESIYGKAAAALADGFASEEIDARVVEDILKEFLN